MALGAIRYVQIGVIGAVIAAGGWLWTQKTTLESEVQSLESQQTTLEDRLASERQQRNQLNAELSREVDRREELQKRWETADRIISGLQSEIQSLLDREVELSRDLVELRQENEEINEFLDQRVDHRIIDILNGGVLDSAGDQGSGGPTGNDN